MSRPTIVTLCGSTRFYEAFQKANYNETMAGRIVLSVGHYPNSDGSHGEQVGCTPEQKIELDKLHKEKIDFSDEILVLNVGGYIGDSTRGEIEHAIKTGKLIRWLEPNNIPHDKFPGVCIATLPHQPHDSCDGRPKAGREYKYGNAHRLEAKLLPGEPWFALRAKDKFAVDVIMHYGDLCETAGLLDHTQGVRLAAMQMINWRSENQDKVTLPD